MDLGGFSGGAVGGWRRLWLLVGREGIQCYLFGGPGVRSGWFCVVVRNDGCSQIGNLVHVSHPRHLLIVAI